MKRNHVFVIIAVFVLSFVISTCVSSPSVVSNAPDELDMILREVSDYLNDSIQAGRKIAIINIQSGSTALSEYIIDVLIANAVNDRNFSVVDRQQLDIARTELHFNMSGEVSDQSAQSVGQMLGAQTIVTGRVSQIGERYRLNIRALEVETVQVQGSNNWNISAGTTITALMRSGGGSSVETQTVATRTTESRSSGISTQTTVNVTEEIPEGAIRVNNAATWNSAVNRIRNGGNGQTYIINLSGNISVPIPSKNENLFGSVTGLTVTIQGSGTLSPSSNGHLLRVGSRQTIIVKNITLRGRSGNDSSLIFISGGGIFRMEGNASVTGNQSRQNGGGVRIDDGGLFIMKDNSSVNNNSVTGYAPIEGGGVYISNRGTFTMEGGTISSNRASNGGGVHSYGTFTMEGGTISGNIASDGGGIKIYRGTFTMEGGIISGNNATSGGGIFYFGGTINKTSGIIYGNDAGQSLSNTASRQGHALTTYQNRRWRNATAGPDDKTDDFGFWLND